MNAKTPQGRHSRKSEDNIKTETETSIYIYIYIYKFNVLLTVHRDIDVH